MKNKRISAQYPFKMVQRLTSIAVLIGFCLSNVQGQIDQGMWMTRGNTYLYSSPHLDKPLFASYAELGYMLSNRFMLEPPPLVQVFPLKPKTQRWCSVSDLHLLSLRLQDAQVCTLVRKKHKPASSSSPLTAKAPAW